MQIVRIHTLKRSRVLTPQRVPRHTFMHCVVQKKFPKGQTYLSRTRQASLAIRRHFVLRLWPWKVWWVPTLYNQVCNAVACCLRPRPEELHRENSSRAPQGEQHSRMPAQAKHQKHCDTWMMTLPCALGLCMCCRGPHNGAAAGAGDRAAAGWPGAAGTV